MSRYRSAAVMVSALLVLSSAHARNLEVDIIPLTSRTPYIFVAPIEDGGPLHLFVLESTHLLFRPMAGTTKSEPLLLPEHTSAVDIADIDDDGVNELVAVVGDTVVSAPLEAGAEFTTLFQRTNQLTSTRSLAYPFVLVTEYESTMAIALPCAKTFEFWSVDGTLLASFALTAGGPAPQVTSSPLNVWDVTPTKLGQPDALEFRVSSSRREHSPEIASEPESPSAQSYRLGNYSLMTAAADLPSSQWPWFSLNRDDDTARVLYALNPPRYQDTLIRFRRASNPASIESEPFVVTPQRRYPGRILMPRSGPGDFNGDDHNDILLWKSPMPGRSAQSLVQASLNNDWPVEVTLHTYRPRRGLYTAAPESVVRFRVPVMWFFEQENGAPIHNLLIRDFDSDGFADLGLSTAPNRFDIWTHRFEFDEEPSFSAIFDDEVSLVREIMLGDDQSLAWIMRSERNLYVLRLPEPK